MTELLDIINNCGDLVEDQTGKLPCTHYVKAGFCTLPGHFRCLEYVARREPNLSYTAISDYTACHRKFYWSWLVGVESKEKPWVMALGLYASTILGWLHDARVPTEIAIKRYVTYIDRLIGQSCKEDDEFLEFGNPDLWKMKAMFDVYIEKDYHLPKGVPEYEFRWAFDGLPRLRGFIDRLDPLTDEGYHGWEYKWTGNADNFSKFLIGDQLTTYFLANDKITSMTNRCFLYPNIWRRTKKNPETMLDFFERCKSEIRKDPEGHFFDRKYWRHEFDLEGYKVKTRRVCDEVVRYIKEGKGMEPFYQNKKNCRNPWPCDFLRCCENDIQDPWNLVDVYKQKEAKK